ncbi:hypothetical protein ZHAS_00014529 [Anopheles sinensis]|uniref:Uncharacterized protein n=1 Tax=Anopheles sinensis TaxID=74873 RepID=A0A084W8J0_ANOSI|nr:hypothetical protein ZHAS_00014529 [Anopheles sinensis]
MLISANTVHGSTVCKDGCFIGTSSRRDVSAPTATPRPPMVTTLAAPNRQWPQRREHYSVMITSRTDGCLALPERDMENR